MKQKKQLNRNRSFKGFLAWMGVWIAMCAVGDIVIGIESFSFIALWGALSFFIANLVEDWINSPQKQEDGQQ